MEDQYVAELLESASSVNKDRSIKNKFEGAYHIDLSNLQEPEGTTAIFRVRNVNENVVEDLCRSMLKGAGLPFNAAPMIVMAIGESSTSFKRKGVSQCKFVVLDGNHRLKAIRKAYDISGEWLVQSLLCQVYVGLTQDEALMLGVNNNSHNEHVNIMTDLQKAKMFRNLLIIPEEDDTTLTITPFDLTRLYNILGIHTVSIITIFI